MLRRLITKLEMLHIPGFLCSVLHEILQVEKTTAEEMNNWKATSRDCVSEDLQRFANSRWLTDGSDQNRSINSRMWSDNVLFSVIFLQHFLFTELSMWFLYFFTRKKKKRGHCMEKMFQPNHFGHICNLITLIFHKKI